jgi:hypothetical protein
MSRGDFKLVAHPEKAPAVDFLTRSGVGPFVDTGVDVLLRSQPGLPVQVERVYLSAATIHQLAQMVGVNAQAGVSEEREQQLIAQGKLEGLREGLDGQLVDVAGTLRRWLDGAGLGSTDDRGSSGL